MYRAFATLRPLIMLRCEKGQLKGQAVKGMAGKPGVAEMVLGPVEATGYNNSNLTPLSTTVVSGEWEPI